MTRFLPNAALAAALAQLLLLSGCGTSNTPQAASTASGEILPGSISDAMLDTSGSQAEAPLAPAARAASAKADTSADATSNAADVEDMADTAPAAEIPAGPKPAASPKPEVP
jgi:hypothetical protein